MTRAKIVVVVGTDHHPFDRVVDWADRWASEHLDHDVFVQYGRASAPAVAKGVDLMTPQELGSALKEADVVVTHGGPGTIAAAEQAGKRPIVLPRDPSRGEHVDGHQMRFAAWLARKNQVSVGFDVADIDQLVAGELREPTRVVDRKVVVRDAALRVGRLVSESRGQVERTGPVVYIAGSGRSGSTIFEHILGQDPRIVTLGEVHHLWERGIEKNELCGCGAAFHDCEFWSAVGGEAFGGWDKVDRELVRGLAGRVDRQRRVVKTAFPRMGRAMTAATIAYSEYYRRIYAAALTVAGAEVVVDSGKHPSLGLALSHNPDLDLRVLHLIRDSMGVSFSWSKAMARPEASSEDDAMMTRYSAAISSAQWAATNLESELLRTRGKPMMRLLYEDFVSNPQREIDRVWTSLRLPGPAPDLVSEDRTVMLRPNHTVAGNPSRFAQGATTLRPDRAWTKAMPRKDRWKVAVLTAPLRMTYGYRGVK